MKRLITSIAAACLCAPLLASAAEGWVVADISLQAGPDTDYPSIAELDAGTSVSIQGCIEGWTWCDVIVGEDRGWVPGTFLEEEVSGRPVVIIDEGPRIGIPLVTFSIGAYWDRHYHSRPFYTERQRFESHAISAHAPPRPNNIVATAPRPEARPRPLSGTAMPGGTTTQGTATTQRQATTPVTTPQRERVTERVQTQPTATPTRPGSQTQTSTAQRNVEERRQPPRPEQQQTEQQHESLQSRSERQAAKPSDTAPQMTPKERPPGERPAQRPQQQVARAATDDNAKNRQHEPKPKDELKKSDSKKQDKDSGDNGGG